MRLNEATLLEGMHAVLVPYRDHHVIRYNEWMQSAELQQLTASEALTLQQEYDMQKSWHLDDNKCTFIILQKEKWDDVTSQEIDCMCGDVNLYFLNPDDRVAEIEIMIAESSCRRKGIGREALLLMMQYGVTQLQVSQFIAKIGLKNEPSLSLFKKLGFEEESMSKVFQEVTLQLKVTERVQNLLGLQTRNMEYRHYKPS